MKQVQLTADLIEAFAGTFLSPRYDRPSPTPAFHRQGWELYCSPHAQCMLVAPREHAKSTALTFVYILAEVCFRSSDYVILLGSTEDMAAEQLSNIREELLENDDLRREFGVKGFEQDSKTDIIVRCDDGHRFRVLARGAEQKIRGKMWKGKRPNLMVGDDMEDDEQVENVDRRRKFRRWFFRAAKQALSAYGRCRVHGTILHEDSLLSRLRRNGEWHSLFFKAHRTFDDFGDILWPEHWPEARLRARQREFVADGDAGGYSQEFLNDPQDNAEAFLKQGDFLDLTRGEYDEGVHLGNGLKLYVGSDFAVSKKDAANRTSFVIGGPSLNNDLYFIDFRVGRWDSLEIIDQMFAIQLRWEPETFFVEDGVIWKTLWPTIAREMRTRNLFINFEALPSVTDKATRAKPWQGRMRAGACRYNKQHEDYAGFEQECLRFRPESEASLDDQFDAAAQLARGVALVPEVDEDDFTSEEEFTMRRQNPRLAAGRSAVTGY